MAGLRWNQYDPPEKMTIERPDSNPLEAEILWRNLFATNGTVPCQIRATVFDEQHTTLFFVTGTRNSPSEPGALAAIRHKVTDLVNTNSWTRDETYSVDGA